MSGQRATMLIVILLFLMMMALTQAKPNHHKHHHHRRPHHAQQNHSGDGDLTVDDAITDDVVLDDVDSGEDGSSLDDGQDYDDDEEDEEEGEKPQFRRLAIRDARHPITVGEGEEQRLYCGVKGTPRPVVRWYKEKRFLHRSAGKGHHRVEVRKKMIRIKPVELQDAGNYTCVAANPSGTSRLRFHLTVEPKKEVYIDPHSPHWTKPKHMIKTLHAEPAGNTVIFKCIAGGDNLTTRWYKNNQEIQMKNSHKPGRLGGFKFRHSGQVITLESVVLTDVASYTCKVSNHLGTIAHTYELDVTERSAHRPILTFLSPVNQTLAVGDNYTVKCRVYSDAHPYIFWRKMVQRNGSWTDPYTDEPYFDVVKSAGINSTDRDLQYFSIRNVTLGDAGKYSCVAGNSIGVAHVDAWLNVIPQREVEVDPVTTYGAGSLMWLFIALPILFGMIIVNLLYWYFRSRSGTPKLTPIKNPDCIPRMEHLEEPGTIFGDELWQKLLFSTGNGPAVIPMPEQNSISIPYDVHWEINKKHIFLHEAIDEGFFGQVYRAGIFLNRDGKNEKVMGAVKMLKNNRSEKDMADLITEMEQLKRIGSHINIISLIGICTQEGVLWLITEYAEQGNLRDFLRRNRPTNVDLPDMTDALPSKYLSVPPRREPITYQNLISASYQVARGMEFLAQKKCVHRDLAARNVLVTNDFVIKIADFGLARDVRSQEYYRKVSRGHLPYKWMAIEAMVENVFTHATDVWSFGVLLWEVFTLGGSPYPGIKTAILVQYLKEGNRLDHPQFASPLLYRLMRDCWEEEPSCRPRFRQLLEDLERMLNATTSEDYIDLNVPCDVDYSVLGSDTASYIDDDDEDEGSARGVSPGATGDDDDDDDSDSVFEPVVACNQQQQQQSDDDPEASGGDFPVLLEAPRENDHVTNDDDDDDDLGFVPTSSIPLLNERPA